VKVCLYSPTAVIVKKDSNTEHKYNKSKNRKQTNTDQFIHVTRITHYFINDLM